MREGSKLDDVRRTGRRWPIAVALYVVAWCVLFAVLWPFYAHFGWSVGVLLGVPFGCAYVVALYVVKRFDVGVRIA